jgi:hypothetical protein
LIEVVSVAILIEGMVFNSVFIGVVAVVSGVVVVGAEAVVVGIVVAELNVVEAVVPGRCDSRRRLLVSSIVRVVALAPATAASVNAAVVSAAPPHPVLISASAADVAIRLIRKTGLLWLIRYSLIQ